MNDVEKESLNQSNDGSNIISKSKASTIQGHTPKALQSSRSFLSGQNSLQVCLTKIKIQEDKESDVKPPETFPFIDKENIPSNEQDKEINKKSKVRSRVEEKDEENPSKKRKISSPSAKSSKEVTVCDSQDDLACSLSRKRFTKATPEDIVRILDDLSDNDSEKINLESDCEIWKNEKSDLRELGHLSYDSEKEESSAKNITEDITLGQDSVFDDDRAQNGLLSDGRVDFESIKAVEKKSGIRLKKISRKASGSDNVDMDALESDTSVNRLSGSDSDSGMDEHIANVKQSKKEINSEYSEADEPIVKSDDKTSIKDIDESDINMDESQVKKNEPKNLKKNTEEHFDSDESEDEAVNSKDRVENFNKLGLKKREKVSDESESGESVMEKSLSKKKGKTSAITKKNSESESSDSDTNKPLATEYGKTSLNKKGNTCSDFESSDNEMDKLFSKKEDKMSPNKKMDSECESTDTEMDKLITKKYRKISNKKRNSDSGSSDSEIDKPLSKKANKASKKEKNSDSESSDSEVDKPFSKKVNKASKKENNSESESSDSEMDIPLVKRKRRASVKKGKNKTESSDSDMDQPLANYKKKTANKEGNSESEASDSEMEKPLAKIKGKNPLNKRNKSIPKDNDMNDGLSKKKDIVPYKKKRENRESSDSKADEPLARKRGKMSQANIASDLGDCEMDELSSKNDSASSGSDIDEPLSKKEGKIVKKQRKAEDDSSGSEMHESFSKKKKKLSSDSESDEPLAKTKSRNKGNRQRHKSESNDSSVDEPMSQKKRKTSLKEKKKKASSSSTCEIKKESALIRKKSKTTSSEDSGASSDSHDSEMDKPLVSLTDKAVKKKLNGASGKISENNSDSDAKMKTREKKILDKADGSGNDSTSDTSVQSDSDNDIDKKKEATNITNLSHAKIKKPQSKKSKEDSSDTESSVGQKKKGKGSRGKTEKQKDKLANLKRYLKTAGIRISNYSALLQNCKSVSAQKRKLLGVLEEHGLKGKPTLEKCKKLREKIERKKEFEELDLGNIITDSGRGRRNVYSVYATRKDEQNVSPADEFFQRPVKPSRARIISESDSE